MCQAKFLLVSFILFSALIFAQPSAQTNGLVTISPSMHHLGKIPDSKTHNFAFTITNNSTQNMRILRVAVSCGCTIPEENVEEVVPGQSTQLKVIFDPKGRRGYARWDILIYTNLAEMPTLVAPFDVEILRDAILSQDFVSFGEFQRGNIVEQEIWLAPEKEDFEVKKVELLVPDMNETFFDIKTTVTEYDGFYPGKRKACNIKLIAHANIPYGRWEGILKISSNIPEHEVIELPFLAKVSGLIGLRPDYLPMNTLVSGEHIIRRIMVFHREGNSFQITKLESDLPFLVLGFAPILEDQYYQVIVTVKKDMVLPLGEFRGRIVIYTTYEDMPKIIVPVQGIVVEKK